MATRARLPGQPRPPGDPAPGPHRGAIGLTGKEGTQLEYKFALGSWDSVEKGASCDETANRQLTLAHGATGTQTVNDVVLDWRNVSPCGNQGSRSAGRRDSRRPRRFVPRRLRTHPDGRDLVLSGDAP